MTCSPAINHGGDRLTEVEWDFLGLSSFSMEAVQEIFPKLGKTDLHKVHSIILIFSNCFRKRGRS